MKHRSILIAAAWAVFISFATNHDATAAETAAGSMAGVENSDLADLRREAEAGRADAQFALGEAYDYGEGVAADPAEAAQWYERAAEQGHREARHNMGYAYLNGEGVERDHERAVYWYRLAADDGFAPAQVELGLCYAMGYGVKADLGEARAWWRRAAEQGNGRAREYLAGTEETAKPAAAPARLPPAVVDLRKKADAGDADAQFRLAFLYIRGEHVAKDDAEVMKWLLLAAAQEHVDAQMTLAARYGMGEGVTKNREKAAFWYKKAAENGDANAQYIMGMYHERGLVFDPDLDEAVRWYRRAVENGNEEAKERLAEMGTELIIDN